MQNLITPLRTPLRTLALCMALLSVTACGSKENASATQVAAKVGSEEISVHQVNQVLSRANTAGANPEAIKVLTREVLEKLIDQQLAVDQATEKKLHRTPDVVAQIESARREILARAYAQQVASEVAPPTADEVKQYYASNPQLFAERRVFNIQEVAVPPTPGVAAQLRALSAAGKGADDVVSALKAANVPFQANNVTRAAEQIPLEALPKIHALKDGQSTVLESPQAITYVRVVASQSAPMPEAAALPRVEQFLRNQRSGEAVNAQIKKLRESTKITYMGEFDANRAGAATSAPAAPAAPSKAAPAASDPGAALVK